MNLKQRKILQLLKERNAQKYSELFKHFEYEDKFPYHLKHLLSKGYVNKRDALYFITSKGISFRNKFEGRFLREVDHKTPRLLFICRYKSKYLLKSCFRDDPSREQYFILPGGALIIGDDLITSAKSILKKKFDIEGTIKYRSTHHYINRSSSGDVLFDNICLVYDVEIRKEPSDLADFHTISEVKKLKNIHPTIRRFILDDDKEVFSQEEFTEDFGFMKEDGLEIEL